jgi:glutamate-1-semialdehyde aminotransferase
MLERGVWLPPSGYELWTLGTEHGPEEVDRILDAASSFVD